MGNYDPRDPIVVATQITNQLKAHWLSYKEPSKTKLLITQGDPMSERGISAITPLVANMLGIKRGLVTLDDDIDPNHSIHAPRDNVILEYKYSQMLNALSSEKASKLDQFIDLRIHEKNEKRKGMGKSLLKPYYKDYALLQEVTKAGALSLSGDITVAHTAANISEFSVTSFYEVGIDLGLLNYSHYVSYGLMDEEIGILNRLDN